MQSSIVAGATVEEHSSLNEVRVEGHVRTYVLASILIFFAIGGNLPGRYSSASSLAAMSDEANTVVGVTFQAVFWLIALYTMSGRYKAILNTCKNMKIIVALAVIAPLSAIWSQNPSASFRRGVFLVFSTLFAFYLVNTLQPWNLAKTIVIAGAFAGVLGILVSVLLPEVGLDAGNGSAWQGIFHSKNGCAQIMLFFLSAAIPFPFRSHSMRLFRILLVTVSSVLIVMANAKTAWILTPVYLSLMVAASKLRRFDRKDATFLAAGAFVAFLLIVTMLPMAVPFILPSLGKDSSLSGRVPLWGAAFVSILKHPLLGYGFAAFWTGLQGESLNIFMSTHFEIYQAQNGLLELGLELGLLGIGLLLAVVARALRDALVCFQYSNSNAMNWYVSLLALTIAYNVDETFIEKENFLPWLLFLVACVGLAEEANKVRRARSLQLSTVVHRLSADSKVVEGIA